MLFNNVIEPSYVAYQERRSNVVKAIQKAYPDVKKGFVFFFAAFEDPDIVFRQESTFYYFSGIDIGDLAISIDISNQESCLYIPNCVEERKKWCGGALEPTSQEAQRFSFGKIETVGQKINGFRLCPYFDKSAYENLLSAISDVIKNNGKIFVLNPNNPCQYFEQRFILNRIKSFLPELTDAKIIDISEIVTKMRRKKNIFDIGKISNAINLTALAHEAAAGMIEDGALESEVQAAAEYIFTGACAKTAYPSIVVSGKNATILHYQSNCDQMNYGELILIDIGAKLDHYCADITRTYPVSGQFDERQCELYNIVLEAQKYIAELAKPGYYLRNEDQKDKSLTHLALAFFAEKGGYDKYFTHSIGHFLGLDVHDVGSLKSPLQEGDVITIEPGLYIPDEKIGIRIEDNYWIAKDHAICLSDMIPKEIEEVEAFMKEGIKQDSL